MISSSSPTARGIDGSDAARLVAEGVSVRFGGLSAIGDVTLTIDRGRIMGLIGPNGAGKTTLVNCMTGFQAPTEGRILLGGSSTAGWTAEHFRHKGVARTFQAGRLFKGLTVLENVEVTGNGMGLSRRQAHRLALEMIDWLGLGERGDVVAGALPYTDERRVGIARALLAGPAFLLLDEPAAGMSDAECDELLRIVTDIPKSFGCGILLIEHNMRMVMGACDLIHVLDSGKTIAEGTPAEIQRNKAVLAAYLGSEGEKQLEMAEHHG
jgi:branched-chain amino acid transport system ATP-binding protein